MKPGARLAAFLRPGLRGRSPAQRAQNPYHRLYPGRAPVDAAHPFQKERKDDTLVRKFLEYPGARRGKR